MTDTQLVANVVQGEIVFPVLMEDPIIHTVQNNYRCADRTCPCWQESRERLPLNGGGRPFSLLR